MEMKAADTDVSFLANDIASKRLREQLEALYKEKSYFEKQLDSIGNIYQSISAMRLSKLELGLIASALGMIVSVVYRDIAELSIVSFTFFFATYRIVTIVKLHAAKKIYMPQIKAVSKEIAGLEKQLEKLEKNMDDLTSKL